MAVSRHELSHFTAVAGADLSDGQFKAVAINSAGRVLYATATGPSDALFVLQFGVNSGEVCELAGLGNVTKAVAGGTIYPGDWVTAGASATLVVTSAGNARAMGVAVNLAAAAAAGDTFSLYLRR